MMSLSDFKHTDIIDASSYLEYIILYSYFMSACSIVKTITTEVLWTT